MPAALAASGARFRPVLRDDFAALGAVVADGADLLVDCVCFTARDARLLEPLLADVGSAVMMSSKAVYVDDAGNHVNSDVRPRFDGPVPESQATMRPGDGDPDSREGYGANKVAAEHVLLDSGYPVTVLRPSKVHGEGASPAREWVFVRRVLERRPAVLLAGRGEDVDHTSAAANIAALVERVADVPAARVLNSADPDAPDALTIARTVASHLGHEWQEVLVDRVRHPDLGRHPWLSPDPVVLDTSASLALGYEPVGTYAETVAPTLDWLVRTAQARLADDDPFFARYVDYDREDAHLARSSAP